MERPLKQFYTMINKDNKNINEIDKKRVDKMIDSLLVSEEKEEGEIEEKKGKHEEIAEIYDNCLKGFKYEIIKNKNEGRYKILAQYNEKKLKIEGNVCLL